jgi:nucleoside triphosphate pyrophosphatase
MRPDNSYKNRDIVLASASPRRKEILALTGLEFRVDAGDYEETMDLPMEPHELARFLSREKADAVALKYRNALIIAADTFLLFEGGLLGKPRDERDAGRMLARLNGRSHSVITGFTVLDTANKKSVSDSVETKVYFRRLTSKEISSYVKSGEPLDKAGSYGIQGLGALLVEKIEGDYFNVMGLPIGALAQTLKKFGIRIL